MPGLAFMHIPLPEYLDMYNIKDTYGTNNELLCCSSINTGLYNAMKNLGTIKSVTCGHDHGNDFYGDYNGIKLHYGRKTGVGGHPARKEWHTLLKNGARIFEVTIDQSVFDFESWIREEDGAIDT